METTYKCSHCKWTGELDELEFDTVETCMGNDEIEMCPKCGSLNVREVQETSPI